MSFLKRIKQLLCCYQSTTVSPVNSTEVNVSRIGYTGGMSIKYSIMLDDD